MSTPPTRKTSALGPSMTSAGKNAAEAAEGAPRASAARSRVTASGDRGTAGRLGSDPLGLRLGPERLDLCGDARAVPAKLGTDGGGDPRHRLPGGELAPGEQAQTGAPRQHVAQAHALLAAGRMDRLGQKVGQALDDRLRKLAALRGHGE